jgi:hypothetical protein
MNNETVFGCCAIVRRVFVLCLNGEEVLGRRHAKISRNFKSEDPISSKGQLWVSFDFHFAFSSAELAQPTTSLLLEVPSDSLSCPPHHTSIQLPRILQRLHDEPRHRILLRQVHSLPLQLRLLRESRCRRSFIIQLDVSLSPSDSRIARAWAWPLAVARQEFHRIAAQERQQRACGGESKQPRKSISSMTSSTRSAVELFPFLLET